MLIFLKPRCFNFSSKRYKIVGLEARCQPADAADAAEPSRCCITRTWDDFKGNEMPSSLELGRVWSMEIVSRVVFL